MAKDILPTIWPADPHTLAKLEILGAYLKAWMPILSRQVGRSGQGEVTYVDGFSGPGEYKGGEDGSPRVAIKAACKHRKGFDQPIRMYFIEKREDRFNNLSNLLAREYGGEIRNVVLDLPIHGSADMEIRKILGRIREKPGFNPVLIFLDQFGYSAVPMELICDTLSMPSSEILSFMNWRDLNRYITDETKWAGISRAFEGDEWKEVLPLEGLARSRRFLELYDQAIRQKARADFCCTFSMHDQGGQLLYWLIFCSNSDRGLEEMKKAMWSVDVTGRFQFSDKHMNQLSLLPSFTQQWLADALVKSLDGREMTIGEIRHYVLNETPCYQYNGALKLLEDEGRLSISRAPDGRRRGSFKKFEDSRELIVRFQKRERQTQLF